MIFHLHCREGRVDGLLGKSTRRKVEDWSATQLVPSAFPLSLLPCASSKHTWIYWDLWLVDKKLLSEQKTLKILLEGVGHRTICGKVSAFGNESMA